jgi:hypothetical protein
VGEIPAKPGFCDSYRLWAFSLGGATERAHRFGGPVLLLSDGEGLYFRKQTREGAAWMFRYRFAGRERWMTLGNYHDMRGDHTQAAHHQAQPPERPAGTAQRLITRSL